jgi:PAS domain S-box-containing protein
MSAQPAIDYESIFLHAPVGMCISENRIIQSSNEALARMFGYSRAELDGLSFRASTRRWMNSCAPATASFPS